MSIKYKDVEDLGFERTDGHDPVFYKKHGYQYFFMALVLMEWLTEHGSEADKEQLLMEWDCVTHLVTFYRQSDKAGIISKRVIKDIDELKTTVKFFKK